MSVVAVDTNGEEIEVLGDTLRLRTGGLIGRWWKKSHGEPFYEVPIANVVAAAIEGGFGDARLHLIYRYAEADGTLGVWKETFHFRSQQKPDFIKVLEAIARHTLDQALAAVDVLCHSGDSRHSEPQREERRQALQDLLKAFSVPSRIVDWDFHKKQMALQAKGGAGDR